MDGEKKKSFSLLLGEKCFARCPLSFQLEQPESNKNTHLFAPLFYIKRHLKKYVYY